ncbi:hypothetical protein GGI43DRAFT_425328 [Trichoderma evansii]
MADYHPPSVEEDQSSLETPICTPQSDEEAKNTEHAPDVTAEEQRAKFSLLCAAHHSWGKCSIPAVIPCQICHLVAYCTEACMTADAEYHSRECPPPAEPPSGYQPPRKSPDDDVDDPVRDTGVFWANYAATDVLNLAENEGAEYNGLLRVLLTGTFGLRHLIYSVVAMPETASPSLEVTISEMEPAHLYRTFLSLIILWKGMDINKDPYEIADLVTHVWYSYTWPPHLVDFISGVLVQDLNELVDKIILAVPHGSAVHTDCFINTWGSNKLHFEAGLSYLRWNTLVGDMGRPICHNFHVLRDNDVAGYGEHLGRAFARMSPSRVAGLVKWRRQGLVLPHGDSELPHACMNPIFFPRISKTPTGFTNEPLSEWPMSEILDYAPYAAKEDVYGKMVTYVREMLVKFQLRLKKKGILVRLISAGTVSMAGYLAKYCGEQLKFDRIEAGHVFDIDPQMCFLSFSPLLRHEEENPFATLLIMTREIFAKSEKTPQLGELIDAEKIKIFQPVYESLDSIAPPVQSTDDIYSPDCVHRHFALQVFDRNWDMFSDRYLADAALFGFKVPENSEPKRSIFQTGWLGLQFKQKNTVKARWPNRFVYERGKDLTEEDATQLRRWMSWSTTKPERWLEWKKVKDITWAKWSMYYQKVQDCKDYGVKAWERLYGFVANEEDFLWKEREYEFCECGTRLNECKNEDKEHAIPVEQEPAVPTEQEPTTPTVEETEDEGWMQMDPVEGSSAAAGRAGGTAKKSKKKKKKKAGKR